MTEDEAALKEQYRDTIMYVNSAIKTLKDQLDELARMAHKEGFSYCQIAGWMGLTEAAVRLKFKRRGWIHEQAGHGRN
jgi:DNA-directed RNA polymerase specialized sigma24 family protein